ncbi:MAG: RHS repeat-associated core domain-containing protein, partial [Fimbriimonadaceae bacterium]|nr:RHS repeat-associated core domain-containing protein [Fimbriimonadaceae bacterium]
SRSGYVANYTYDDNGNRLTKTLNSVTETYIYGPEERLEEITGGSDPREFTYDDGGRTATIDRGGGDVTNFTYDEGSRVTQITRPGMTTNSYSYNGLDTRVGMTDSLGSSGFNRDGAYVTDSVLNDGTRAYTPGISQRQSSATKFVLDDYLGTTGRLLDSGENVTDTFTYDAFGVQTARTGSTVRPFGYAGAHGYQEDGDTGFKLLGHRFYDPSTGRFLTRDPIKDGTNWYAYCGNSPLSRVDPDGQEWHDPSAVTVDEDFKGKVFVVGEREGGKEQVFIELRPGESTPKNFDADLVIIVYSDGRQKRYFIGGADPAPPLGPMNYPSEYHVDSKGNINGVSGWYGLPLPAYKPPMNPREFTPENGKQPWPWKGDWNEDIKRAKRGSPIRPR